MQVIDGSEHIMGRLATHIAKQLLSGEEVIVVNAEKIVITGRKVQILEDYNNRRNRGVAGRNRFGPYYPRMPDRMFKRTVRGMIPYQEPRGRTAFKKLKVYIGIPLDMRDANLTKVEKALDRGATRKILLGDVATWLGADF
ncbi:MAG: 50S ribosomal protein L13 [Thermoplasmata archaeon]|nr:50S ribosomal protein L13 [Thermoplasmata archaeon]